jgi:hypothetical protein
LFGSAASAAAPSNPAATPFGGTASMTTGEEVHEAGMLLVTWSTCVIVQQ